jgi:hypothetical protein
VKAPTQARSQGVAFVLGFVGSLAFVVVTLLGALSLNALSPAGALERLFLGVAAIAWAGAGFLLGRAFSFSRLGPFSRARELAFGSGALALTFLAALLAQAARPVQSREVAELKVEADAVVVDGARLAVANGEVGLQYQVVESPALGLVFAVPLALVGAEGSPPLPLEHGTLEGWLLESSWKRAEALNGRGFSVKRRTETFKITAGSSYLLQLGEREPTLEKRR